MFNTALRSSLTAVAFAAAVTVSTQAFAGPLPFFPFDPQPTPYAPRATAYAPVQEPVEAEEQAPIATQSRFKRQVVNYATNEAPGTVVVDTPNTYLYYVLGGGNDACGIASSSSSSASKLGVRSPGRYSAGAP